MVGYSIERTYVEQSGCPSSNAKLEAINIGMPSFHTAIRLKQLT